MKEGNEETIGEKTLSKKSEICSVGQEQAETIGLPGELILWILGRR